MTAVSSTIAISKKILPPSECATPPRPDEPVAFGRVHTDHMIVADFLPEKGGWQTPEITPYAPWSFSPDAVVFHYGQQIFEGLKAYRGTEDAIYLFRPEQNAKRFYESALTMGMEPVPPELFLACIRELVSTDKGWILPAPASLYIRPMLIPLDTGVSYRASLSYRFAVILSPAKSYFVKEQGVKVLIERERVRSVRGGVGEAKAGGNYGGSVAALSRARALGADHVLWLDSLERRYIEEVGAMNIMFVYEDHIVTPALSGAILRGITRQSLIELSAHRGKAILEKRILMEDILADAKSGKLKEAFGCGTAAVVSPISAFINGSETVMIGNGAPGKVTLGLKSALEGIQHGSQPDPLGWRQRL